MMTRIALRVRSALVCALYHKCLRLSGMGNANTGQIQNLMANDTQFLVQLAPAINMVFLAPIQIVASLVWLGLLVGPSFLAGLARADPDGAHPGEGGEEAGLFALRRKQLKFTDERVKLTNEALQGVRVVKMYGWDGALKAKMAKVRKQELALVEQCAKGIHSAAGMFIMVQPLVVTVACSASTSARGTRSPRRRSSPPSPSSRCCGRSRLPPDPPRAGGELGRSSQADHALPRTRSSTPTPSPRRTR